MACSPGSAAPPAHDSQDEPVQIAPTTMVAGEPAYISIDGALHHQWSVASGIWHHSATPSVHSLPDPNSSTNMIGPNSSTNPKVPAEVFSSAAQPASPPGAQPRPDQVFDPLGLWQPTPDVSAEVVCSAAQPASPPGALPYLDQFLVLLQILHRGKTVLAASDAATSQAVPPVLPQQLQDLDRAMESRPPELMVPSAATPLYNALLQKLNRAEDPKILEKLAGSTVFDKLLYTKPYGSDTSADQPGDLASRFEHLLRVTNEQRQLHIRRLASRQDPRDLNANTLIFHADDMMEILNEWRNDPKSWCDKLHAIDNLPTQQERHQARKKRFSTMLFHLMGDRAIPELFIKHPICGTDQAAAIISTFVNARQTWRDSEACKEAREISEKKDPRKRPSQRKFWLRGKQKRAEEQC
jgi:hypothetical protein